MKGVFWFLFLAALAVALALLMGGNPATVSLFWPPYRVDLSFNFALFAAGLGFVVLYLALRALALLRRLPRRAHLWRVQQLERAAHASVMDALAYQISGRFVRGQRSAERAIGQLTELQADAMPHHAQMAVLARLLAAESAHSLGNGAARDEHLLIALEEAQSPHTGAAREGALLRAAGWAIETRDANLAAQWLGELPQGASRRIQTLRLKLKVARLQHDTRSALDMVRLLAKHRAFTPSLAQSLLRALVLDALRDTHDGDQLLAVWQSLDNAERKQPDLALAWLERWEAVRGELRAEGGVPDTPEVRRVIDHCLLTAWEAYGSLGLDLRRRLILRLEALLPLRDAQWLSRIERAQQQSPADAGLQYLAGQAFMQHQLWGKAAYLLGQASHGLQNAELLQRTWCSLARLAEGRGDDAAAQAAWKKAALTFTA